CYSFPRSVLGEAEPRLKLEKPDGYFPWPTEALARYQSDPKSRNIGVPQGGAVSCVISNLVLDLADKRIAAVKEQLGGDATYLRFCDDMILLSSSKSACRTAFETYLRTLEDLKLPYHPPHKVTFYDSEFWD